MKAAHFLTRPLLSPLFILILSFSFRFLINRYLQTVTMPLNEAGNTQERLRLTRKRKTESPAVFVSAMFLKLSHKKQILMTYISNSRSIKKRSSSRCYTATSVAPNGIPPKFLKRKYWNVEYSTSEDFGLRDDAKGIYTEILSVLPNDVNTKVVVGKWYVPFIFVKEGNAKDQIKSSTYYSMILIQRWEEVYSCENAYNENRQVVVNVEVETEVVKHEGQEIGKNTKSVDENGVVWFAVADKRIGLGSAVMERMKWEEERFGWKIEPQRAVVKRSERFDGGGSNWKSYRCYGLVESFVLQRMDESLVLTFEFKHVDKLRTKWES